MARKSSKTAHVMNLLAGDNADIAKSDEGEKLSEIVEVQGNNRKEKKITTQSLSTDPQETNNTHSPSAISIIDMSPASDPVAELIKDQLQQEFGEISMSDEDNPPSLEPSILPEEEDTCAAASSEQETGIEDEAAQEVPKQSMENEINETEHPLDAPAAYEYINVMEYIVRDMVKEYMEKFNLCCCDRCLADVTALTLTRLPSKYIVVERSYASPLLNFHSNRLSPQIIVELTKACSVVKENPHH